MVSTENCAPQDGALIAQLEQLNERTRWYSSRLWQEPFTSFGIAILALQAVLKSSIFVVGATLLLIGTGGMFLIKHLKGLQKAKVEAVDNLKKIEKQLCLEQATKNRDEEIPDILRKFVAFLVFVSFSTGLGCLFYTLVGRLNL